jgi:hypothetical protein
LTVHYLTYVFIPDETDIDIAVAKALWPFGDEFPVKPWKRYLDASEVAAMARCYTLPTRALKKLAAHMEDWNGGSGGVDDRGLHAVLTYNPAAQWDWYEIGGRWNNRLPGNGMIARSLRGSPKLKRLLPHDFLTPDGVWHAQSRFVSTGWPHGRIVEKRERRWLEEFTLALVSYPGHRVVGVDRHS